MDGIGDTLRVSLAADPVEEVKVGYDILKSLKLRTRGINFIACPSCSRQNFDVVSTMNALEERLEDLHTPLDVAVTIRPVCPTWFRERLRPGTTR